MIRSILSTIVTMGIIAVMAAPVAAGEMAKNAEIKAAVSGSTLQGSMLKDAYAEYYHEDGSISGKNYSGKWRVDNDMMCFKYGEKPETCWGLEINGPAVTLFKNGQVDGNGMLIKGNLHKF